MRFILTLHSIVIAWQVSIQDTRALVGRFLAFDRHFNLVIGDCEERRIIRSKSKKGLFMGGPCE